MYDLDAFDPVMFDEAKKIMKDRFPDLVTTYFEDAQEYITKIKQAVNLGNKALIAQYAHPLKSSSAGLGIMAVSIIARDLEAQAKEAIAKEQNINNLNELIMPIEESFLRAQKRLYLD